MSQTRRQLLKTALGGAAGMVLGTPVFRLFSQGGTPQKLSEDLFVLSLPGEANVVAQTGSNGVVLVDGGSVAGSDALLKAVAGLPGYNGRIQMLFNTHWHPEQTGSNERLGKAGTTIIAHENTRLWLTQNITWPWNGKHFNKLPKIAQPNKTLYTTGQLDSGIRYGYVADAAHTDGDIYVYFPKQNVLAAGGVITGAGWPDIDYWTGGWIGGIVGALERLQTVANADTRIVPANGPMLTLADLKSQAEMYSTIYGRLSQMLNKGRGPREAVEAKPTKEFDARMGNPDAFVQRAFESLWAYLSPDA